MQLYITDINTDICISAMTATHKKSLSISTLSGPAQETCVLISSSLTLWYSSLSPALTFDPLSLQTGPVVLIYKVLLRVQPCQAGGVTQTPRSPAECRRDVVTTFF